MAEKTDIERWRLRDERGRQTWHYLESNSEVEAWPQTLADRYHLGLDLVGRMSIDSQQTENRVALMLKVKD